MSGQGRSAPLLSTLSQVACPCQWRCIVKGIYSAGRKSVAYQQLQCVVPAPLVYRFSWYRWQCNHVWKALGAGGAFAMSRRDTAHHDHDVDCKLQHQIAQDGLNQPRAPTHLVDASFSLPCRMRLASGSTEASSADSAGPAACRRDILGAISSAEQLALSSSVSKSPAADGTAGGPGPASCRASS